MALAVIKEGPKCAAQLAYLNRLAAVAADRVPRILSSWSAHDGSGFAMEMLEPYAPSAEWPVLAERAAAGAFWISGPVVMVYDRDWQTELKRTLGIAAPDWAWLYEKRCAVHGDLTMCNTMRRDVTLVFGDAVWPERVPQIRQVDQARIVQSMLGWELMTGYQSEHVVFEEPSFLYTNETQIAIVAFWTMVMMARIASSTAVTDEERAWARHLREEIGRHFK